MSDQKKRIAESLLLFLFSLLWSAFLILDLFTASGLFFIPAVIVTVATAVFAGIMLFKRDLDGHDYAKKRMFALSLPCFSWLLEIIAEAIIKQRFSTDIFILGAFVLFLICFFRDNPDDTSWNVTSPFSFTMSSPRFPPCTVCIIEKTFVVGKYV